MKAFSELALFVRDMEEAAAFIDGLPADRQFTQDELATLDDVRNRANALFLDAEAAITTFQTG